MTRAADEQGTVGSWRTIVIAGAVFLGCVVLYAPWLGRAPAYLAHDEAFFALTGRSIALTGRDMNGRFMPLYFQWPAPISLVVWFQPVAVYFTAVFLKLLPLTDSIIRLPAVVVGAADVALLYVAAERLFRRRSMAIVGALLLALTPAHFIHSRLAMDFLYPLPFVLSWLICLYEYDDRRRLSVLFAGTSLLGLGFYSYIASVVMMPVYFAITCAVVLRTHATPWRPLAAAAAGFAWPLVFLVRWVIAHPSAVADTAGRYGLLESSGALSLISERLSLYWRYFDPVDLFVVARGYTVNTTHRSGVFLGPLIACLAVGINEIVNYRRTWRTIILIVGFISAPLAAVVVGQAYAIQRELVILPFVVLIATLGLDCLLGAQQRAARIVGWVVIALVPVQFAYFYVDYLTGYRVRSAFGFDGSVREALQDIIDRERGSAAPVYLSQDIPYIEWYWRLYLAEHHREDLIGRSLYFDPAHVDVRSIPNRSLVLVSGDNHGETLLPISSDLQLVRVVRAIDHSVCCVILERTPKANSTSTRAEVWKE